MKITNKPEFTNAQSLAKIAFFASDKVLAASFWVSAMKCLKTAYGVK